MKFEIKSRFSSLILFSLETESLKLCVETAVKSKVYLGGADLSGADLGGVYLRGAYLGGADLRGADLRGADLRGADLGGAYLGGVYLRGADLRGADLGGADLGGADLRRAYLGGVYLRGADLRGVDLRGADLRGTDLGGADLRDADLCDVDLCDAYLGGADLRGAKIIHDETELLLVGERPALQLGPLGSRRDYLLAFLTDHGVYVRAGCFFNTLEAFSDAVAETHGDSLHAKEYGLAIQLIELHTSLWRDKYHE